MEALIPTATLATMVLIIKILVIMLTSVVPAPIRILSLKIIPVIRMPLIPRIPFRRIPILGLTYVAGYSVLRILDCRSPYSIPFKSLWKSPRRKTNYGAAYDSGQWSVTIGLYNAKQVQDCDAGFQPV